MPVCKAEKFKLGHYRRSYPHSAKSTRRSGLRDGGYALETTSCASRRRATEVHLSTRVRVFSSFRFPETKSAHLKFSSS